jgi:voltage-gated potassium channel
MPAADARPTRLLELSPKQRWRAIGLAGARCLVSVTIIGGLYAVLPFRSHFSGAAAVIRLVVGIALFLAVMYGQVKRIARSRIPELDAVQSLVISVAVFLCTYASCYLTLSRLHPDSFSQHLDRTGSLYFTTTTFGTVGYGDIVAQSHLARLLVTSQILLDLAFIAAMLRLVFAVSRRALAHPQPQPKRELSEMHSASATNEQ